MIGQLQKYQQFYKISLKPNLNYHIKTDIDLKQKRNKNDAFG